MYIVCHLSWRHLAVLYLLSFLYMLTTHSHSFCILIITIIIVLINMIVILIDG
jgi:hypothetical protein